MEEDTHGLPFGFDCRNDDGVWRSIYLGDASLARSIFNLANERVHPSVLAYIGPNAHVDLVHTR